MGVGRGSNPRKPAPQASAITTLPPTQRPRQDSNLHHPLCACRVETGASTGAWSSMLDLSQRSPPSEGGGFPNFPNARCGRNGQDRTGDFEVPNFAAYHLRTFRSDTLNWGVSIPSSGRMRYQRGARSNRNPCLAAPITFQAMAEAPLLHTPYLRGAPRARSPCLTAHAVFKAAPIPDRLRLHVRTSEDTIPTPVGAIRLANGPRPCLVEHPCRQVATCRCTMLVGPDALRALLCSSPFLRSRSRKRSKRSIAARGGHDPHTQKCDLRSK